VEVFYICTDPRKGMVFESRLPLTPTSADEVEVFYICTDPRKGMVFESRLPLYTDLR
jgi:hypothetical protein